MLFHKYYHPEIFQGNLLMESYFEGWTRIYRKGLGFILMWIRIKGPLQRCVHPFRVGTGKGNESLQGHLELTLAKVNNNIWMGSGTSAGLEVAGETDILETETWRS